MQPSTMKLLLTLVFTLLLTSCGGGASEATPDDSGGDAETSSTWDQMNWDEGQWG